MVECRPIYVRKAVTKEEEEKYANDQSTGETGAAPAFYEAEIARIAEMPAAARRVPSGEDDDAEEAELGFAESGARALDERKGSHGLHPRRRPQPAGALDGAGARGPREGLAGRAVPHRARDAGLPGDRIAAARPFQVRDEDAEGGEEVREATNEKASG